MKKLGKTRKIKSPEKIFSEILIKTKFCNKLTISNLLNSYKATKAKFLSFSSLNNLLRMVYLEILTVFNNKTSCFKII